MRFFWLLQIVAILVVPPSVYALRHRDDPGRALRGSALVLAGMYTLFFGMFAIGEVFADPGGWAAVAGTALWLVPLVALGLLAWFRPDLAVFTLGALVVAVAAVFVWSALGSGSWTAFEDTHGPIRALIAFALAVPLAVLGWHRPRAAGVMLLALSLLAALPVVITVGRGLGPLGWPLAILTAPAAIVGALFLLASAVGPRHVPTGTSAHRLTPKAS